MIEMMLSGKNNMRDALKVETSADIIRIIFKNFVCGIIHLNMA